MFHIIGCFEKDSVREIPIAIDLKRKEALGLTSIAMRMPRSGDCEPIFDGVEMRALGNEVHNS